ncbi:MAG: TRAP transporter large permease subunit [Acidobacteriota bacterium]
MVVLPLAEMVAREVFRTGIPASQPIVQHLVLWVGFLGAALAARDGRLLALATGEFLPEGRVREWAKVIASAVGAGVATLLACAAFSLVSTEREAGDRLAAAPLWVVLLVLPISFALIAWRLVRRSGARPTTRAIAALGVGAGLLLGAKPEWLENHAAWPGLLIVAAATALGAPLFAALGGAAVLLFMAEGVPIAAVPSETYRLAVNPALPAIPLFTLTGFVLAEGKAPQRLLRLFRALFGWVPGGTAVMCVVLSAFFTTFTGGSGVTILALGPFLYKALRADGYSERFSIGLLTASGSLGLLFPPSLPMILYGIVGRVPITDLFRGGQLPGWIMLLIAAGLGVREGRRAQTTRVGFDGREALSAVWGSKWELLLPLIVLFGLFSGLTTIVEASALTAACALIVQCGIYRDLGWGRDLWGVLWRSALLVGGVLIILGVAVGLTSYLVDAQVPTHLLDWTRQHVHSKYVFLLGLNLFLLLCGCLMDIFSAIAVVVPLIAPLGLAFGIHPVHLGVIFIANLELGYLMPPVGLNLYLASYRFEKPILQTYRAVLPMLLVLLCGVLLITYVPLLTTAFLGGGG